MTQVVYDPDWTEEQKAANRERLGYRFIHKQHGVIGGDPIVYRDYKCHNCDATDTGKFFPSEKPALMINCHKCGAGRQMSIDKMLAGKRGMYLVPTQDELKKGLVK